MESPVMIAAEQDEVVQIRMPAGSPSDDVVGVKEPLPVAARHRTAAVPLPQGSQQRTTRSATTSTEVQSPSVRCVDGQPDPTVAGNPLQGAVQECRPVVDVGMTRAHSWPGCYAGRHSAVIRGSLRTGSNGSRAFHQRLRLDMHHEFRTRGVHR